MNKLVTSHLRGHKIYTCDGFNWFYDDNDEPTEGTHRPCGFCGKESTKKGHDGCIPDLPDVLNACCGHGKSKEAYIHFSNGEVIRGSKALSKLITLK